MKPIRLTVIASLIAMSGCVAAPAVVYPVSAPATYASFCSAGFYQCPVPAGTPVGTNCACPGIGAPSYGVAQ